jgi:alpha/beta superfamily hydrolase
MLSSRSSPKHVAVCERAAAAGAMALRFDFAGRGESAGTPDDLTVSGELDDLRAAVDLVRQRCARATSVVGSSMGGAVAVLAASELELAGLVTIAAPAAIPTAPRDAWGGPARALGDGRIGLPDGSTIPRALFDDARSHDVAEAARRVRCPWLVLHGERDTVVGSGAARLLARSGKLTRCVVHPTAGHRFRTDAARAWLIDAIDRFVAPLAVGVDPF